MQEILLGEALLPALQRCLARLGEMDGELHVMQHTAIARLQSQHTAESHW